MATARIILDLRKAKKDGTYPVKIRIAHIKDFQRIGTTLSLSENDFKKLISGKNLKKDQLLDKAKLDALLHKANSIIETLEPFDFATFSTRFSQKGNRSDLIFLLMDKSAEFERDEKYSSRNLYQQAAGLITEYINRDRIKDSERITSLPISQVTAKWLAEFEKWALKVTYEKKSKDASTRELKQKYSKTTLGMYLIRVRAIFNEVISTKELSANAYPFHRPDNKGGYKIPQGINNKRSLTKTQIMSLYNYEPESPAEQFAKDVFIFSYLASGMNAIDIFRLKWTDINDNNLTFVRKKTQNKPGGTNQIAIKLNEDLWSIINRQGKHHRPNSDLIFNVIPANATEKQLKDATAVAVSTINTSLKKIAAKLGITENISSYFARHSYSTTLMNSNAPLAFISKQLGHKDLKTTQNYLGSFTSENSDEYHSKLLDEQKIS